jgi:hypothetical protein
LAGGAGKQVCAMLATATSIDHEMSYVQISAKSHRDQMTLSGRHTNKAPKTSTYSLAHAHHVAEQQCQ